jgi:hypothetical protein
MEIRPDRPVIAPDYPWDGQGRVPFGYKSSGVVSFTTDAAAGASLDMTFKVQAYTLDTGLTTSTIAGFIPDGAQVVAMAARITTTITTGGDRTTLAFGDGSVTFASKVALVAGTTFVYADAGSGQVPKSYAAPTDLVLTVSGGSSGNITGGAVRIVMWYWMVTPPQS